MARILPKHEEQSNLETTEQKTVAVAADKKRTPEPNQQTETELSLTRETAESLSAPASVFQSEADAERREEAAQHETSENVEEPTGEPLEEDPQGRADNLALARLQQKANRIAVIGRWLCVALFVVFCIALGVKNQAFTISAGVVTGVAVIAEIVTVSLYSRKLAKMKEAIDPVIPIEVTQIFAALEEDFAYDEMKHFTDAITCKSLRAFRDDFTLEVEFTLRDGTVLSALFENDRVRLLVNEDEESAYLLNYCDCDDKADVYAALTEQIKSFD